MLLCQSVEKKGRQDEQQRAKQQKEKINTHILKLKIKQKARKCLPKCSGKTNHNHTK